MQSLLDGVRFLLFFCIAPVLQMFLTSAKPTIRFAAVKTLNMIAMIHPDAVTSCNVDLENLISDSNRSIATLAITTLLKVSFNWNTFTRVNFLGGEGSECPSHPHHHPTLPPSPSPDSKTMPSCS